MWISLLYKEMFVIHASAGGVERCRAHADDKGILMLIILRFQGSSRR
jgi:hypothetical protein